MTETLTLINVWSPKTPKTSLDEISQLNHENIFGLFYLILMARETNDPKTLAEIYKNLNLHPSTVLEHNFKALCCAAVLKQDKEIKLYLTEIKKQSYSFSLDFFYNTVIMLSLLVRDRQSFTVKKMYGLLGIKKDKLEGVFQKDIDKGFFIYNNLFNLAGNFPYTLSIACFTGHSAILEELLPYFLKDDRTTKKSKALVLFSCLFFAWQGGQYETASVLLTKYRAPICFNYEEAVFNRNLFYYAIKLKDFTAVQFFIDYADIKEINEFYRFEERSRHTNHITALYLAAEQNCADIFICLFQRIVSSKEEPLIHIGFDSYLKGSESLLSFVIQKVLSSNSNDQIEKIYCCIMKYLKECPNSFFNLNDRFSLMKYVYNQTETNDTAKVIWSDLLDLLTIKFKSSNYLAFEWRAVTLMYAVKTANQLIISTIKPIVDREEIFDSEFLNKSEKDFLFKYIYNPRLHYKESTPESTSTLRVPTYNSLLTNTLRQNNNAASIYPLPKNVLTKEQYDKVMYIYTTYKNKYVLRRFFKSPESSAAEESIRLAVERSNFAAAYKIAKDYVGKNSNNQLAKSLCEVVSFKI